MNPQPLSRRQKECPLNFLSSFPQISGFPVFGTAQPTADAFPRVLERVRKGPEDKPYKVIWFNTRQEPVVYLDGVPYAPRNPDK